MPRRRTAHAAEKAEMDAKLSSPDKHFWSQVKRGKGGLPEIQKGEWGAPQNPKGGRGGGIEVWQDLKGGKGSSPGSKRGKGELLRIQKGECKNAFRGTNVLRRPLPWLLRL